MREGTLNKVALMESCPEEHCVDTQQDPGTLAESEGGQEKAEPETNFKTSHKCH